VELNETLEILNPGDQWARHGGAVSTIPGLDLNVTSTFDTLKVH
jgi:hypothetical protein